MESQKENSPARITRMVLQLERNRVAGILWSHEQRLTITYEMIAFYISPRFKGIRRAEGVDVGDLCDLWTLVKEAQNWLQRETGESTSFVLTKFSVIP
jgi:hypothetical protein